MVKRLIIIILFIPVAVLQTFVQVPFAVLKWLVDGKPIFEDMEPWMQKLCEW